MVDENEYENTVDWIEGRDDALAARRRQRDITAIVLAGGEVG